MTQKVGVFAKLYQTLFTIKGNHQIPQGTLTGSRMPCGWSDENHGLRDGNKVDAVPLLYNAKTPLDQKSWSRDVLRFVKFRRQVLSSFVESGFDGFGSVARYCRVLSSQVLTGLVLSR